MPLYCGDMDDVTTEAPLEDGDINDAVGMTLILLPNAFLKSSNVGGGAMANDAVEEAEC